MVGLEIGAAGLHFRHDEAALFVEACEVKPPTGGKLKLRKDSEPHVHEEPRNAARDVRRHVGSRAGRRRWGGKR